MARENHEGAFNRLSDLELVQMRKEIKEAAHLEDKPFLDALDKELRERDKHSVLGDPVCSKTIVLHSESLALKVIELERRCVKAERLLGLIIATLNLSGNAHWFADLPEDWHKLVKRWTTRYQSLKEPK